MLERSGVASGVGGSAGCCWTDAGMMSSVVRMGASLFVFTAFVGVRFFNAFVGVRWRDGVMVTSSFVRLLGVTTSSRSSCSASECADGDGTGEGR